MRSELRVALRARLYGTLSERREYLREDTGERVERTAMGWSPSLSLLDAALISSAGELDRFCGYAVGLLRDGPSRRTNTGLVDALGLLDAERIAAMAYALPEDRRRTLRRNDLTWARAVRAVEPGMAEAIAELEQLVASTDRIQDAGRRMFAALGPGAEAAWERFDQQARRYRAGLPHDLSAEEVELVEQATAERIAATTPAS
jgi:hypothetical protein